MTKKELLKELEKYDDEAIIYCFNLNGIIHDSGYAKSVDYNKENKTIEINFDLLHSC